MSVVESNGLAYDGRGFTMEVIAGVRGRTDRIGRVRVYVGMVRAKGKKVIVLGLNLSDEPFQLEVDYQFEAVAKAVVRKLQNLIG